MGLRHQSLLNRRQSSEATPYWVAFSTRASGTNRALTQAGRALRFRVTSTQTSAGKCPWFELEDEGKGRLVAEKKSLQTEPTFQIIDPFQASVNCLLVVAFAKTNSPNYPFAVSLAEGAERYGNAEIGGKHMHVAVFGRTQADTGRALALIGYTRGWRSAFVFAQGKMVGDTYHLQEVLSCYMQSCQCRDIKAHCIFVIDDPFEDDDTRRMSHRESTHKYAFPCKLLVTRFHFQSNHPSSIVNQIQAAGVEQCCTFCPHFTPESFMEIGRGSVR